MNAEILVIDDEQAVRTTFELALTEIGHKVITAKTGEEGLARAKEHSPELVFLDLRMPGIDGVETLRRLRADGARHFPVYIVTAFRQEYLHKLQDAAHAGLTFEVVDKPVTIEQIQSIASAVLEGVRIV